jgi:hypothetical protein
MTADLHAADGAGGRASPLPLTQAHPVSRRGTHNQPRKPGAAGAQQFVHALATCIAVAAMLLRHTLELENRGCYNHVAWPDMSMQRPRCMPSLWSA